MNCKLSDIILPQHIWMDLPSADKNKTILNISQLISSNLEKKNQYFTSEEIFSKLSEREQKASTGADHGLAIPHACLATCDDAMLFLFRCSEGVEFQSMDGLPSQLFFVILAPEKRKAGDLGHLQILSSICRLMRHVGVREKLLHAPSVDVVVSILKANE